MAKKPNSNTPAQDVEFTDIPARNAVKGSNKNRYGLDPNQEKYAQLRAAGAEAADAVLQAGLKIKNPLLFEHHNPLITSRIKSLQDAAASEVIEKIKLDKQWVIDELLRQYHANGTIVQSFDKMGNETNAPQKANEAIKCLELLGRELGMFVDRKEVRIGALDGLSDAELTRIATELAHQTGFDPGALRIEETPGSQQAGAV